MKFIVIKYRLVGDYRFKKVWEMDDVVDITSDLDMSILIEEDVMGEILGESVKIGKIKYDVVTYDSLKHNTGGGIVTSMRSNSSGTNDQTKTDYDKLRDMVKQYQRDQRLNDLLDKKEL